MTFLKRHRNFPVPLLPLILIFGFIVIEVLSLDYLWKSGEETIQSKLLDYDRMRAIASYEGNSARKSEPPQNSSIQNNFYENASSAIVSAQIVAKFKEMAAGHSLELLRSQEAPQKQNELLNLVGSSFDLSGSMNNIYALVRDIETASPILLLDKIDLHVAGSGAVDQNSDTVLTATISIYAAVAGKTSGNGQ